MRIANVEPAGTYDDYLLMPKYSEITSRMDVDLSVCVLGCDLKIPILSSPMDTVFSIPLALELERLGGMSIIPRFIPPNEVLNAMEALKFRIPSVGVHESDKEIAVVYKNFTRKICIDSAHGHHKQIVEMANYLRAIGFTEIMTGNVCTADGAKYLAQNRIQAIRVGVGPGHNCITRKISGHGVPQLYAISECANKTGDFEYSTIADGGIRGSDDCVKSLAAGADCVMIGRLFASTFEAPSVKNAEGHDTYRGMASAVVQQHYNGRIGNQTAEGVVTVVEKTQSVADFIGHLVGGMRSGLSYSGARTIKELQTKAEFVRVSPASVRESNWYND